VLKCYFAGIFQSAQHIYEKKEGSGSGPGRSKNMRILRIGIPNTASMVPKSLETLGSINTLGKAVGLTGAFSGHIFGLGAAAAVAVVATATAVFSCTAAVATVSLSAAGGRLLLDVSFLTGVVLGVGCNSGLQQRYKFHSVLRAFFCNTGSVVDLDFH
jgi:hypothetical protein